MVKRARAQAALLGLCACSTYVTAGTGDDAQLGEFQAECDGLADGAEEAARLELAALDRIDDERRRGGRCGDRTFPPQPPLRRDPRLTCAARRHAQDMSDRGYVGAVDPDGIHLGRRLEDADYRPSLWVAAVGAGWTDADHAVESWLQNPLHCYKLFARELEDIGVGVYLPPEGAPEPVDSDGDGPAYATFWTLFVAAP